MSVFPPEFRPAQGRKRDIILGGGLAGLSAGYVLSRAGDEVAVIEADSEVGGLCRTVVKDGFRFDLGGHRFFTKNPSTEKFVRDLMGDELIYVDRKSKIFLRGKYFDYPLKPINSLMGLGPVMTVRILADYAYERAKSLVATPNLVSLEDWVVSRFGRAMFSLYFKEYSEKVWGIDCSRISEDWVAKRIYGLSLGKAVKNALFRLSGNELPTLADRFLYPRLGIGRIPDKLGEAISASNTVAVSSPVEAVYHDGFFIEGVSTGGGRLSADRFLSSIPLTALVKLLRPAPPESVIASADALGFRDLIIVTVMLSKSRATDQTWIYIPEKSIPFGRIHEPTNWSPDMAPEGKTHVVLEYFCTKGDAVWNTPDADLTVSAVSGMERLGFIRKSEVIGSAVIRVPKAYPLFEVGYKEHVRVINEYLARFSNLHMIGRSGMFKYHNMDHAIETGVEAAERLLKGEDAEGSPSSDALLGRRNAVGR